MRDLWDSLQYTLIRGWSMQSAAVGRPRVQGSESMPDDTLATDNAKTVNDFWFLPIYGKGRDFGVFDGDRRPERVAPQS